MKLAAALPLLLILLLHTIATTPTSAKKIPPPVLDTAGNPLRSNVQYRALPADGNVGGLGLTSWDKKARCPLDVIEDLSRLAAASGGLPVTFSPVTNDTTVRTSTDVNVAFAAATACSQPTVWKIGRYEEKSGKWYLTTGGEKGRPGKATASSWFKIEKSGKGYKILFCPYVCRYCKVVCGDVGVVGGTVERRQLGLSRVPLVVVFKKK